MNTLDALLDLLALDRLPRTGWLLAGIETPETVAAHALGTALVCLALGPRVEPPLDVDRAVALAVVHDAPEAWLSDVPRAGSRHLPPGAKRAAEAGIADELLVALSPLARERFDEFQEADTREARFTAVCDKLHLGLRLLGYLRAGFRGLGEFRAGLVTLDCSEFPPCENLRAALVAAVDAAMLPPGAPTPGSNGPGSTGPTS